MIPQAHDQINSSALKQLHVIRPQINSMEHRSSFSFYPGVFQFWHS